MSRISRLKASLTQFPDVAAPSWWLLAAEQRFLWEFWSGVVSYPALTRIAPRGDGHPVLVLPGFAASDMSTALLRRFLDDLGYVTCPWGLGRNRGVKDEVPVRMQQLLNRLYKQHGRKVSLVGQSLGGVFARQLAKAEPDKVRQVITLGSPFAGHPLASTAAHVYEWLSGDNFEDIDFNQHLEVRVKPPVPTTSIYSKTDGVVAWQCSIEADEAHQAENIHLRGGSHIGMGSSPVALYLIAHRLAQPEGQWKPFEPSGLGKLLYGARDHLPDAPRMSRVGMTMAQVRAIALALPEVAEQPHFDLTSFRVRGKIFATAPASGDELRVFVAEEDREQAIALQPDACAKLSWGAKVVGLKLALAKAPPALVTSLLRKAWQGKAPRSLVLPG